jgi:hypothetical protein
MCFLAFDLFASPYHLLKVLIDLSSASGDPQEST